MPPPQITFDAADPSALAVFWAEALGYVLQPPPDGFPTWEAWLEDRGIPEAQWNDAAAIVDPQGSGPRIFFQRVPEPKTAKNRVHLDVPVGGGPELPPELRRDRVAAAVDRLVAAGATVVGPMARHGEYWIVMQDPEGNEFCLQ